MQKQIDHPTTTKDKVAIYETTAPLLKGMSDELRELAKKKPEVTLNKNKVAMINRLLTDVQKVLKDESHSKYLDLLDEDVLPQYSDVVLILSQFSAAMSQFRERYYRRRRNSSGVAESFWSTQ